MSSVKDQLFIKAGNCYMTALTAKPGETLYRRVSGKFVEVKDETIHRTQKAN